MSGVDLHHRAVQKAAMARGDLFQDIVAAFCILSVLFEEYDAVIIEDTIDTDDEFDDIILESGHETICLQVKNGPEYRFTESDLTGSGRLDIGAMVDSARHRMENEYGTRFIVFTSYLDPDDNSSLLREEEDEFELFEGVSFRTRCLQDGEGFVEDGVEVELIFGVPGIESLDKDNTFQNAKDSEFYEQGIGFIRTLFQDRQSPRIRNAESLFEKSLNLATRARENPGHHLDRETIARLLEVAPTGDQVPQEFPIDEECIVPDWLRELMDSVFEWKDPVLIEGDPGSGKSTGIQLLCNEMKKDDKRVIRYFLYDPADTKLEANRRLDPEWFRDQLAYQLKTEFSEAFDSSNTPIWTGVDDLQNHINKVAGWAGNNDREGLVIIDGLDHAVEYTDSGEMTLQIEGTVFETIRQLSVQSPLQLVLVGRPLPSEIRSVLDSSEELSVPRWDKNQIELYYTQYGLLLSKSELEAVTEISDGLPVILTHLLKTARTFDEQAERGLQLAIENAPDIHEGLEAYYESIWDPIDPQYRDVLTLFSVSPTSVPPKTVSGVLELPWIQDTTNLNSGPLAHTLSEIEPEHYLIFHESFREYVEQQLSVETKENVHRTLFDYYYSEFEKFPANGLQLKHHAEEGPGIAKLSSLAELENVLHWWEEGVHLEQILEALELAFEASVSAKDTHSILDSIILGSTTAYMLSTYADHRMRYFIAIEDKHRSLRHLSDIRKHSPGSEEVLTSLQLISRQWPSEIESSWLEDWFESNQELDEPREWNPEAFFEVAAEVTEPEKFWEAADAIQIAETGERFVYEIFRAVRLRPSLLDHQSKPPEWFFGDIATSLEAAERLGNQLPKPWQKEIQQASLSLDDLSPAALHTLWQCGIDADKIRSRIKQIQFTEPKDLNEDYPKFSPCFYAGAILSELDEEPNSVLATIESLSIDQPEIRTLIGSIGAASSTTSDEDRQRWVDTSVELFIEMLERDHDHSLKFLELTQYQKMLTEAIAEFSNVANDGSDEKLSSLIDAVDSTNPSSNIPRRVAVELSRNLDGVLSDDDLPQHWESRYRELLSPEPVDEPPSEELLDLAIRAGEANRLKLSEKYYKKAIQRGFRYGYHKDMFLYDVWESMDDAINGRWELHLGQAIQLLNWAYLLHDITDGDETGYFEYHFLSTLLDQGVVEYDVVANNVRDRGTSSRIRRWRLRNPENITREELSHLIWIEEKIIQSRHYTSREVQYFTSAANVAHESGWPDLVEYALSSLDYGDFTDTFDNDDDLRELISEYDTTIPEDVLSEDDSEKDTGAEIRNNPSPPPESIPKDLHDTLSSHTFKDPVSEASLESFSTDELINASIEIIDNRYYKPTAAEPVARVLISRGQCQKAKQLLRDTISSRGLIHNQMHGKGRFEMLARVLIEIERSSALKTVLEAWNSSYLDVRSNNLVFQQLVWMVKRTEGEIPAQALVQHSIDWLRELMSPYEYYRQMWGVLEQDELME